MNNISNANIKTNTNNIDSNNINANMNANILSTPTALLPVFSTVQVPMQTNTPTVLVCIHACMYY